MVVGINGIPCFPDASMPRFLADNMRGKRAGITREDVLGACRKNPGVGRRELAGLPGCSEQTIRRRLEDNNVGGGQVCSADEGHADRFHAGVDGGGTRPLPVWQAHLAQGSVPDHLPATCHIISGR